MRRMQKILQRLGWCVLLLPGLAPAQVEYVSSNFTSATALGTAIAAAPACLQWCAIGTCFWLRCTIFGCYVETSLRITHMYPDLVVTAWTNDRAPGVSGNPYVDANILYGTVSYALGAGQSTAFGLPGVLFGGGNATPKDHPEHAAEKGAVTAGTPQNSEANGYKAEQQRHRNLRFKDTMAVGHPATGANQSLGQFFTTLPALCPSLALPLNLYYSSQADAVNWRTGAGDMLNPAYLLMATTPYVQDVGMSAGNNYGPLYLRTGFVNQFSDYKAGAVFAQRSVDILTKPGEFRVYQWLGAKVLPVWAQPQPGPATLIDQGWQKIVPIPEPFCHSFGYEPEDNNPWTGQYGWNYWERYNCCINDPGAIFLGFVLHPMFCIPL